MKKGVNCWCFPREYSLEKCIETAKKAGFDSIEINMSDGGEPVDKTIFDELSFSDSKALTTSSTPDEIRAIKEMAERYGIDTPSLSTSLFWSYPLTSNDIKIVEKAKEIVRKMIDAAVVLGADTILVVPGLVNEEVSYAKAYERSRESLKELAKYAEEKKVGIGVENVWNRFLLSPVEMRRFVEEIGSPYVGTYFDVGNVLNFSYPEYWIEVLAETIRKVHVKDFSTSVGNINGFTNLLAGDVNWKRVMEAFRKIGYDSYVTAELSPYKFFPENLIYDTSRAMESIFRL